MSGSCLLEACVGSVEGAVAAQVGGAGRVELCADLLEGGCTPSLGAIQVAREMLHIPMNVIVRPRGGDFLYSHVEYETMKRDIDLAGQAGADGVVVGILTEDGQVDAERTGELIERARPMSVTFHRAFDVARDPFEALETLIALGVDRLLTSGQEATALEGSALIAELVRLAGDRLIVMPGGGINEGNLAEVAASTRAQEFHARAPLAEESRMVLRKELVLDGGARRFPEYTTEGADARLVAALAGILKRVGAGHGQACHGLKTMGKP